MANVFEFRSQHVFQFKCSQYNRMGNCVECVLGWFRRGPVHRISGKKIQQVKQLAEGGYGFVSLVEDIETKKNYAMKKLICQTPEQKAMHRHQVTMMKQLSNCPHVVGFYGEHSIERDGYLQAYILMELAEKTVYDLLLEHEKKNRKPLNQGYILTIFKDVALGLKQMHEVGIVHRDVKVENILLSRDGVAKLCDFGSCSKEKVNLASIKKSLIYKYEEQFEKNTTLMYRPPEMIDLYLKYPINEKVDIWMLGCVLYVMNYKFHPFQEEGKLSIVNAAVKYSKTVTPKMQKLMRHLLTPNPNFRPGIEQILKILDEWQTRDFELNAVAALIKKNEQHLERGEYDQAKQMDWRSVQ